MEFRFKPKQQRRIRYNQNRFWVQVPILFYFSFLDFMGCFTKEKDLVSNCGLKQLYFFLFLVFMSIDDP
jgi:hypothetical protein